MFISKPIRPSDEGRAIAAASPVPSVAAGAVATMAITADAVAAVSVLVAKVETQACLRQSTVVVLAVAATGAPATIA
jgi:hypothetical protein